MCKVVECGKRVVAFGMCDMHYRRVRAGRPLEPPQWTWDDLMAALRTRVADIAMGSPDACWTWTGELNSVGKYGLIGTKLKGEERHFLTHRLMYGEIPDGLELDHLCLNTLCCNPAHMEPVTHAENVRRHATRTTHCPRGHAYDEINTAIHGTTGKRICLTCRADDLWLKRHPGAALDDPRRRGRYPKRG
jgi:HNH endonuclease